MSILVVGLGNILLKDEGVGVHVIEDFEAAFEPDDGVTIVDGGTSAMDLCDVIADHKTLIVVDSVKAADAPPGTVVRWADDEVRAFFRAKISPHQLGLCDVLATLALTDNAPEHVVLVGIVPKDLGTGLEMSAEIHKASQRALAVLVDELTRLGRPPVARAERESA